MDMDRDGSWHEMKIRGRKRTGYLARVPPIIESAIRHRIRLWKKCRRIFVHDWNPHFVKLSDNFGEPFVTGGSSRNSFVCSIDVSAAPESVFLRCNRIDNHASNRFGIRGIEPTHEQQTGIGKLSDRAEASKRWVSR